MKSFFSKMFLLLIFLMLTGIGCIQFRGGGSKETDGGVWKTVDQGEKWQQKKVLLTAGGLQSIGGMSITTIAIDPQDQSAIYLGTAEQGLLYSYDGSESWQQAKSLAQGRVSSVIVDPKNKCTIYVTMGPRVWKSTDCNRTFSAVYFENRADVAMTQIEVDWFNPNILYAGSSAGDLQKSADGGATWTRLRGFDDRIQKIYMDPFDSRVVYVGLRDQGIWKTTDGGTTWSDSKEGLKDFDGGRGFVTMASDAVTRNTFLIATKYGILRTNDGGTTWQPLNLQTPASSVTIHSLAVNPRNVNEIYYGTGSTFYRSVNGGANWATKKLPTSRAATALLIDSKNPKTIYLGATLFKK